MTCSARLSWRLPPRSRRWRSVRPDETGIGATPASLGMCASLLKRSAPAVCPRPNPTNRTAPTARTLLVEKPDARRDALRPGRLARTNRQRRTRPTRRDRLPTHPRQLRPDPPPRRRRHQRSLDTQRRRQRVDAIRGAASQTSRARETHGQHKRRGTSRPGGRSYVHRRRRLRLLVLAGLGSSEARFDASTAVASTR